MTTFYPPIVSTVLLAPVLGGSISPVPAPAPRIPLVAGPVTVSAVHEPGKGDYESIVTVEKASADSVRFSVSANVEGERRTVRRRVLRVAQPPRPVPGTTETLCDDADPSFELDADVEREAAARTREERLNNFGRADVSGIFFDSGKATLQPSSDMALRAIVDVLVRHSTWKLDIQGHTDRLGDRAANLRLSKRRAEAVRRALAVLFPGAPDRLTVSGFGGTRPKATNSTPEGRARNRRVELVKR